MTTTDVYSTKLEQSVWMLVVNLTSFLMGTFVIWGKKGVGSTDIRR